MEQGKKVCNELKRVRQEIADANGIAYSPTPCNHKGDCDGTCPACEDEVRYIERELNLRRMLGKAVIVAGLGLSVASCKSTFKPQVVGKVPAPSTNAETVDQKSCATDSDAVVTPLRGKIRMNPPKTEE